MRTLFVVLLLLVYACPVFAQDLPAVQPNQPRLTKADHLRIAAEHLDAAGFSREAEEYRAKAYSASLAEGRPQSIAPAQAAKSFEQIEVNFRWLEFSRTKLAAIDSEPYGGKKGTSVLKMLDERLAPIVKSNGARTADPSLLALIAKLPMKVIADPELVAVPDKPAFVLVGGELGYHDKDSKGNDALKVMEYGTRVELTAHRVMNDKIRLNYMISERVPDNANSVGGIPAMTCRSLGMEIEIRPGETFVQTGIVEHITNTKAGMFDFLGLPRQTECEDVDRLLLLTTKIVPQDNPKTAGNTKPQAR